MPQNAKAALDSNLRQFPDNFGPYFEWKLKIRAVPGIFNLPDWRVYFGYSSKSLIVCINTG